MNLYEAIGSRHSVRKYSDREVPERLRAQILAYFEKTSRLNDRIRTELEILDNTKKKAEVKVWWKTDAPYYLAFYSEPEEGFERNAGYIMEQLILYMTVKGLGTCYLGGSRVKADGEKRETPGDDCRLWLAGGSFTEKVRLQRGCR